MYNYQLIDLSISCLIPIELGFGILFHCRIISPDRRWEDLILSDDILKLGIRFFLFYGAIVGINHNLLKADQDDMWKDIVYSFN
jgi:hypothetical protein